MSTHDTLIRNASIIDGSGRAARQADLAIQGNRIAAIGNLSSITAEKVIDADGLVLAPGFIDAHCHDDRAILDTPLLEPKVSQGVTTVINGNCGVSIAPSQPDRLHAPQPLSMMFAEGLECFTDFRSYFQKLDNNPAAVNNACLCGHSNLRFAVMDDLNRTATQSEIVKMQQLLADGLEAGVLGLSTGLIYPPAAAADTEEVIEICSLLGKYNALYVTHMRNEGDNVIDAVEEALRIGRDAGASVVISHHKCTGPANYGKSTITLKMIEEARKHQTVALDAYPYDASSTMLDPERVEKCSQVIITWSDVIPGASGRDLADIAAELGCSSKEAAERLVPGGAIYCQMSEEDVQRILAYPETMIGSDGIIQDVHPHPRAWGTFPRVLGHYSRDLELFPLVEAVRKMTSLTAKNFGIQGRGLLQEGYFADLVLFDPETVIDVASFTDPCQPSKGIEMVFSNGTPIWKNGMATGARPGETLRRH